MTTKRLGRGLADIIAPGPQEAGVANTNFVVLRIEQIRIGRFQPRMKIEDAALQELTASIKKSGVIEPVLVRPVAHGTYELVAGERRLRASQSLGLAEIPAMIKTLSDKEALELSLVENVQRENLNPIEEAKGYQRLVDEFGYTQEAVAEAVGRDRATVANMLRLLTLPQEIQDGVRDGAVTMGHARALLSIADRAKQLELFKQVKAQQLSVRQIEALAGSWVGPKRRRAKRNDPQMKGLEDELRRALGTKVTLSARKKGGRIVVEYFSQEDLSRLLKVFGVEG
jgi:ParB family chromosome partitioning protein